MNKSQKGFSTVSIVLTVVLILLLVFVVAGINRKKNVQTGIRKSFWERIFSKKSPSNNSDQLFPSDGNTPPPPAPTDITPNPIPSPSGGSTPTSTPTPTLSGVVSVGKVPSEYQALYDKLNSKLDAFIAKLGQPGSADVIYGAGLITANPNAGETLLQPTTFETSKKYLDRLQDLGVEGIALDINYPLMDPQFQGQDKADQYLAFYKKLFEEMKKRNMKTSVEVQPIFPNFSSLPVTPYYQSMSFETYKERVADMLVLVARELKPDYLSVENEPSTAQTNTGFPIANLENNITMITYFLDELNKSGVNGVKYGAGFGNWQQSHQTWADRFINIPELDFFNIHIYPMDGDYLDRAITIIDTMEAKGKPVIESEAWDNKWQTGDAGSVAASQEVSSRNAYSFWQPIDVKFLEALAKFAENKNFEFISPFWSQFFFGYMDYNSAKNLSASKRFTDSIKTGVNAALAGQTTETGRKYQELIK